jgi:uridine kinase
VVDVYKLFLKHHPTLSEPAQVNYKGKTYEVKRGTSLIDFLENQVHEDHDEILAMIMNNRVVSLRAAIVRSGNLEAITYKTHHGALLYRRHLIMMLYEVFHTSYPEARIRIGQAISEGIYFEVEGVTVDKKLVDKLRQGMLALATEKRPFLFWRIPVEEARRLFVHEGSDFKRDVLEHWPSATVAVMTLGAFVDFALGPVAMHTGYFSSFSLMQYSGDLLLQFPDPGTEAGLRNEGMQPKLYQTHKESRRWSELLGVRHVGELNRACISGSIREIVQVAEGLHEKQISDIADQITSSHKKLVFIAGPSSAGKTTFSKRLAIQLRVAGYNPVAVSLDNYYRNRIEIPKDETGEYDLEHLQALDIDLLNRHLVSLLEGDEVKIPKYSFLNGEREKDKFSGSIKLKESDILMFEGIHGLNHELTPSIPVEKKFRIYINALNPLAIDEHNRIQTSDIRLMRRIVRDRHYRGYTAAQTIAVWPSVRRGERRWIFPFQESADVIFDSSLIYEFGILKIFAERYLLEVPRSHPSYAEAYRLLKFLSLFVPMLPGDIPQTSLIREFIGGSGFSY